jgi:hypothetical protein
VFETMGFDVQWYEQAKTVELKNDFYVVDILTESNKLVVFETRRAFTVKELENPVKIIDGRTMLPLREILESIGCNTNWDAQTKTTVIEDKNDYDTLRSLATAVQLAEIYMFGDDEMPLYKVNSSAKVGTLTDEEKAYLDNYFATLSYGKSVNIDLDLENTDYEQAKKDVTEYYADLVKRLNVVPCPESLADVDEQARGALSDTGRTFTEFVDAWKLLENESDTIKSSLGGSMLLCMAINNYMNAMLTDTELYDFFEERNIDTEKVFGGNYSNMADGMKNAEASTDSYSI